MPDAVLVLRDVRKTFRTRNRGDALRDAIPRLGRRLAGGRRGSDERFLALDGCSLSVARGEAVGLVGANGSGKSTLLRVAAGIYPFDEGEVAVGGRVSALIELAAGFHPDLSGRENVYLAGALLGLKRREIDRIFVRIVEFADIGSFLDAPLRTYSLGMGVRLGFAVAAHVPAEVLLIDEVLAVGDTAYRARCLDRMAARRADGAAIVLVSHNLVLMEQFADRVVVLDHGRVIADGKPRATLDEYRKLVLGGERGAVNAAVPALRRGTGQAWLTRFGLHSEADLPAGTAIVGQPLRVLLEWESREPIPEPVLGVAFHTPEGVLLGDVQSRPGARECGDGAKPRRGGAALLEIAEFPLLPGSYGVSAYLRDHSGLVDLDHHQALHVLRVVGDRHGETGGYVALSARWRCDLESRPR